MRYLRFVLLLGLASHKLIWEVLKHGDETPPDESPRAVSPLKRLVKGAKALALTFLAAQTMLPEILPISERPSRIRALGAGLFAAGWTIAVAGRLQLGDNWANLEDYQVLSEQRLVQHGLYRYIRHPIYTGDVLLVLGLELALNSWLVAGVVPLALVVARQTNAEEELLANTFSDYRTYQHITKRFIPFVV